MVYVGIITLDGGKVENDDNLLTQRLTTEADFSDIYVNTKGDVALGHTLLRITDTSDLNKQPLSYLDRYVLIYNGEIFNHFDLRPELEEKFYQFKSHSDTEIFIAAFNYWGEEQFQYKLNGMWAAVVFDKTKNSLMLFRDRFGIKPIYYGKFGNLFIFSSEFKSIYCLNQSYKLELIKLGYLCEIFTTKQEKHFFK